MSRKNILAVGSAVSIVAIAAFVFITVRGGVTPREQYTTCMRDCYGLMIQESSKQYCPGRCTEITEWQPTGPQINEVIAEITGKKTNTTTTASNKNAATVYTNSTITNTTTYTHATNTNAAVDQNGQFYCNWVWPQEIIDKDTKDLVKACTSKRPWCNYADYSYENVGCCTDAAHTDCVTLPNL